MNKSTSYFTQTVFLKPTVQSMESTKLEAWQKVQ